MAAILQPVIVPVFTKESVTQHSRMCFSGVVVHKIWSAEGLVAYLFIYLFIYLF
jgi:hypothetical protein